MGKIFQDTPPEVIVHPLPKQAKYFTYNFSDSFYLTAWMPKDIYQVYLKSKESNDSFFERNCSDCERNCSSFLDQYRDEYGEIDWEEVGPHCDVYDEGYYGQECPEGNTLEEYDYDFTVCEMAFRIGLTYRTNKKHKINRYFKSYDSAFLCASKLTEDGILLTSETKLPSNVFGYDDEPGLICWGRVRTPDTLRGIESSFFSSDFNNDLTKIPKFFDNVNQVHSDSGYPGSYSENEREFLLYNNESSEHKVDTLVIVDADLHVDAFFTFLCAGFNPSKDAPHVMLIPAIETVVTKNGMTFNGYITIPDELGKHWFIHKDGVVLGQV